MVLIIVVLVVLLAIVTGFSLIQYLELRGARDSIDWLLEDSVNREAKNVDQKLDLDMANAVCRELQGEVRNHLRCLELVLGEIT